MDSLSKQFNDWWDETIEQKSVSKPNNDDEVNNFLQEYNNKSLEEKLAVINQFIDESVSYDPKNNKIISDQNKFRFAIVLLRKIINKESLPTHI